MIDRFFIDTHLSSGHKVEITDKEFHHLARVMRAEAGDAVDLINGRGALAAARIEAVHKDHAVLTVLDVSEEQKPGSEIILAQALARPNRLDFIIEKGTELGATQFWLFPGTKSEKKNLTPHQIDRCKSLSISALKQCGRLWIPTIKIKSPLKEWPELSAPFYFGDIRDSSPLLKDVWQTTSNVGIFIGPESGFADSEIELLEGLGAKGVKLNPHILRTETASILSIGLIAHWMMQ